MRKSALYALGLVVTVLVALGLIVLLSASQSNAARLHGGDVYFFFRRQCMYLVGGVVFAIIAAMFDYRKLKEWEWLTWIIFAAVMAMLVAVLGAEETNGSHRWFNLKVIKIQPGEFAKLVTVLVVALWMDKVRWKVDLFMHGAFYPMLLIAIIAIPVLLEPDFGSVMVIAGVGCMLMFVAGTRFLHLVPLMLMGCAAVVFMIMNNENRMKRLFDSEMQYQVKAALAAIGNSDIWGAGLGESMQKYFYLPEAHTDFVFAVGAEELGIVFSVGVVVLFLIFLALSVYIAHKTSDRFGRMLVAGMAFIIFFQAMFNIGVVCNAFPTKGMALPFFSYGGTNLICALVEVGVIMSVGIHSIRDRKRELLRKVIMR